MPYHHSASSSSSSPFPKSENLTTMENFETTDHNAAQQVVSDPPPAAAGSAAPNSSLSPLEMDGMADIDKILGNGISESDFALLESLQLTDDEADNEDDSSKGRKRRRRESNTRKRLSLYQVYYLEKSFKTESKLDTERKYDLANELKMKPKQVTIWFQNRRARSKKNKGVDFNIDFDQILKQYESLQAEREKLLEQNEKLKAEMKDMRHEMVIMKDSLLKYGKLLRAGVLIPQMPKTKPGQGKRTKHLQVGNAQAQQETPPEVNNNVLKEGVLVAPQVQVQQLVDSPAASENSVFDSNSPMAASQGAQLQFLHPPAANNINFIQAENQQENSLNNADSIDNLINNLLDLNRQNGFSNNQAYHAPQTSAGDFFMNPMDMDDETFWQFTL